MRVRSVDFNNDWQFGKGKSDYKVDLDCLTQNIKTRLQSFLGDCFFAQTEGIDWWNLLGSKKILDLRLAVAAVILNTENIESMVEVDVKLDKARMVSITYSVVSVYGAISRSESFDPTGGLSA